MTPFCASATKATLCSLTLTHLELKEKKRFWYMYGNLNFFLYLKIAVFFFCVFFFSEAVMEAEAQSKGNG